MAKNRAGKGDFAAHPPASKPMDDALFGTEDLMRRAVGGNVHHMGRGHPTTLASYVDLGRLMAQQGRWQEAEGWIRMGLDGLCTDIGPNHPKVGGCVGVWVCVGGGECGRGVGRGGGGVAAAAGSHVC